MLARVSEPQRIGGSDRLPTWRIVLSEDPSAEWRGRFLEQAHKAGIFYRAQITVESAALVFDLERPALRLACEKIDLWIAEANGAPSSAPRGLTILVVDAEGRRHAARRLPSAAASANLAPWQPSYP